MSQPISSINKENGCAVKLSTLVSTFDGEKIYMNFSPQEFIWLQNMCMYATLRVAYI